MTTSRVDHYYPRELSFYRFAMNGGAASHCGIHLSNYARCFATMRDKGRQGWQNGW